MSETAWQEDVGPRVLTLQIIVAALTAGLVMFLVVTLILPGPAVKPPLLLTWIAAAFVPVAFILRLVVPNLLVAGRRREIVRGTARLPSTQNQPAMVAFIERTGAAGHLWMAFLTRTILAAGILEGAAFFCLVAYLVEHSPIALGLAAALIVGVAMLLPTRSGVVRWIENQLEQIERQRRESFY